MTLRDYIDHDIAPGIIIKKDSILTSSISKFVSKYVNKKKHYE